MPSTFATPLSARPLRNLRPARLGRFVFALILGFALRGTAQAGVDRWTPYGPGEGTLQSLVASTRGELYVTTFFTVGEIWQRPSVNAIWRWRGAGFGQPAPPEITALVIHPKNPNALWAVANERGGSVAQSVFRSTDAGASWRKLFTGDIDFQIGRLTVAPTARSVVLLGESRVGTPERLLRSTDLGASWTEVAGVVGPVAAPPDEPGTVYAVAAAGGSLVKSADGGATFRPTGPLPGVETGDEVRTLHATYGRPALVLASLRMSGLYRSTNGGGAWRRTGFRGTGPAVLASEPADPRKIYAANILGLYASDRGAQAGSFRTVANLSFGLFAGKEPTALAAAPGGPYFLAGNDLYKFTSPDGFAPVAKTGIEAFGVSDLRISHVDSAFVALRSHTGCIRASCDFRTLLSTDGGATFTRVGALLSARSFLDATDLAFDPADPHRRLAVVGGIVLLHEGEGSGLGPQVYAGPVQAVEIADGGVLLTGGFDGIHRSDDGGSTWTQTLDSVVPPSPEHPLGGTRQVVTFEVDPYSPEKLFAGALEFTSSFPRDPGNSVLYRSTDAGATWTPLSGGYIDIEFVPGAPSSLYLLASTGAGPELRRSDDFGTTSTLIHTFPISDQANDVATDPNGSGDLYLATSSGVRRSRDGGATWEPTPGGWNAFGPYRRSISQVQVAPDGRLIASPDAGGLFENRLTN